MVNKDETTEDRILAAARKVFISKGMSGARTQDIADEAGINKALLHYYFKNKELLFETVFKKLSASFWQQIIAIFEADNMSLQEKIEAFCSTYIDNIIENPYIPLFILYEMNQRPDSFVKKLFGDHPPNPSKFISQIAAEVKAGNIRPVEPPQLLMNMISMCIFPFIGKPVFKTVMKMDEQTFLRLMRERKIEIPRFIMNSIKK